MTLQAIDPVRAKRLIDDGAVLVDIREPREFARERILGARNRPLGSLATLQSGGAQAVIFHCKSGMRTTANARRLAAAADCQAYVLEGGLDAWKKAGLPVATHSRRPIDIMRQVHITAGALVLLGFVLGTWVAPAGYALSAFVGADLMLAGISGWHGMARLLAFMPWNLRAAKAALA